MRTPARVLAAAAALPRQAPRSSVLAHTTAMPSQPQSTPAASSSTSTKRIFAPGTSGTSAPSQAAQYLTGTLSSADLLASPLAQFHAWFSAAQQSGVHQPETVNLATSSPTGAVSSRMVYLKELDGRGFVVYSNWATSRKAADASANARAALCFWWREAERQVRVEGPLERLAPAESKVYFDTRARGSRIGAWASPQSEVLPGRARDVLERRVADVERRFDGVEDIPVPGFWGGARVLPERVEFWQGRESRLHDRFVYVRVRGKPGDAEAEGQADGELRLDDLEGEGDWTVERLGP